MFQFHNPYEVLNFEYLDQQLLNQCPFILFNNLKNHTGKFSNNRSVQVYMQNNDVNISCFCFNPRVNS